MGMSGAGKDTMAKYLCDKYKFHFAVSTTTRPIRKNEKNGIDYIFLNTEDFFKQNLIEHRVYNTIQNGVPAVWYYGLTKDEIDVNKREKSIVAVVDPEGLKQIKEKSDIDVISIFLDIDYKERLIRAAGNRIDFEIDEFERREKTDKEKFKNLHSDVNLIVHSTDFNICASQIESVLRKAGVINV